MSKIMLPAFFGVFVGAFVFELVRRNNPELGEALAVKAKKAAKALRLPQATPKERKVGEP